MFLYAGLLYDDFGLSESGGKALIDEAFTGYEESSGRESRSSARSVSNFHRFFLPSEDKNYMIT
jgi:hypothetical protein